jgi:hypothetical protein
MTEEEQDALFNADAVIEYINDLVAGMTEEQKIEYDNFTSDFDFESTGYYESEEYKQELILELVMFEIQKPSISVDYSTLAPVVIGNYHKTPNYNKVLK